MRAAPAKGRVVSTSRRANDPGAGAARAPVGVGFPSEDPIARGLQVQVPWQGSDAFDERACHTRTLGELAYGAAEHLEAHP